MTMVRVVMMYGAWPLASCRGRHAAACLPRLSGWLLPSLDAAASHWQFNSSSESSA